MTNELKILNELRPVTESGFSGIPQETRILHSVFLDIQDVTTTGLLNIHVEPLPKSLIVTGDKQKQDRLYFQSSTIRAMAEIDGARYFYQHFIKYYTRIKVAYMIKLMSLLGMSIKSYPVDMSDHGDFLWRKCFAKSLTASDYNKIIQAKYNFIIPSRFAQQTAGRIKPFRGRFVKLDTSKYDVFLSQNPWPAVVSKSTQLVVRYHDAIPIFYPHTIPDPYNHQFQHYFALKSNIKHGAILVCNSENSKRDLVKAFPNAEKSARVIPCIVSSNYYPETVSIETICHIVRHSIEPSTEPKFHRLMEMQRFYRSSINPESFKYIMIVSTIEPRKNHSRLIAAWDYIRMHKYPDLKLVIVGRPGWLCADIIDSMKPFQASGLLFNISLVTSSNLRRLYNKAEAVVCPSIGEGFDLSGIEAMLSGGAVAASDIAVHKEIYGSAAEYFNPYSTKETVDAICQIIDPDNSKRRAKLVTMGAQQGTLYSQENIKPLWEQFFEDIKSKKN